MRTGTCEKHGEYIPLDCQKCWVEMREALRQMASFDGGMIPSGEWFVHRAKVVLGEAEKGDG